MTALSPLNGPTVANTQKMFLLDPLKRMIKKKKKESKESKHHLKNFVKKTYSDVLLSTTGSVLQVTELSVIATQFAFSALFVR